MLLPLLVVIVVGIVAFEFVSRLLRKQDLTGKTVLITGAASGLGKGMSLEFAKRKGTIVAIDINEEALKKTAFEIESLGGKAFTYRCNVGDYTSVQQLGEKVKRDVGKPIDILINNAGIVSGKPLLELSEEHITRTMSVNTLAHLWFFKVFLPDMISNRKGQIVNIVSAAGFCGVTGLVDYCASKFGAFGAHEALRLEIYSKGLTSEIPMTAVCPFYINTGMFQGVQTTMPWLLPILEEKYAVDKIIEGIEYKDPYVVLPSTVWIIFIGRYLPVRMQNLIFWTLGMTRSMDSFKGRGWDSTNPNQRRE